MSSLFLSHLSSLGEALGGIGLFILGMKTMSEGLQRFAGNRFRTIVEKVAGNRISAAFLGSCLAALLQSGSSAAVIVVGFVNAGLISLYQALAVLLGTGIGATVVVQFIAFQVTSFALPAIFIGSSLKFFCKQRKLVNTGDLILGAGLLFLGLRLMVAGFTPIGESALIQTIHEYVFAWRISAVLVGSCLALLLQSASAATGIIIALAGSGMISFTNGIEMVIGENLGIALITLFAALNGTLAAKRTALINLLISIVAITIILVAFPVFLAVVRLFTPGDFELLSRSLLRRSVTPLGGDLARLIANAHTLFNLFTLGAFLPLIGFFARSAATILPGREGTGDLSPHPKFIDSRVINTPTLAMLQAKNEIRRMAGTACSMFADIEALLYRFDAKVARIIPQKEEVLDVLQKQIANFLVLLSRQNVEPDKSLQIPVLLHMVNGLELMGDICSSLLTYLQRKKEGKIHFTPQAMADLKRLAAAVGEVIKLIDASATFSDEDLRRAREIREAVRGLQETMLAGHIKRMKSGHCTVDAGLLYGDMIAAFVKLAEAAFTIISTGRELE